VVAGSGEVKEDNLNNARHVASRHCRNKKMDYLEDKINYLT
jgi:hypothetical protein